MNVQGSESPPDDLPVAKQGGRGFWKRILLEGDPIDDQPVQFSLRSVLLLQTLAAAALSLLLAFDLVGALALFFVTVGVMVWPMPPGAQRARRVFSDLLAGALMPIVCLVFDPGVLNDSSWGVVTIPAILVQIAGLLLWQLLPGRVPAVTAFFCGFFCVGFLLALMIGIAMIPVTLIGLLLLVGLLGTMPFLTAIVYLRNLASAGRAAFGDRQTVTGITMFMLGLAVAIATPSAINELCGKRIAEFFRSLPDFGPRWL